MSLSDFRRGEIPAGPIPFPRKRQLSEVGLSLLPADLREWVPADDLVHFVISEEVLAFVQTIAKKRRTDLSSIVNQLIRNDMHLGERSLR